MNTHRRKQVERKKSHRRDKGVCGMRREDDEGNVRHGAAAMRVECSVSVSPSKRLPRPSRSLLLAASSRKSFAYSFALGPRSSRMVCKTSNRTIPLRDSCTFLFTNDSINGISNLPVCVNCRLTGIVSGHTLDARRIRMCTPQASSRQNIRAGALADV